MISYSASSSLDFTITGWKLDIAAVQLENQILAVIDEQPPFTANATVISNIERLLDYHFRILQLTRATLGKQFYGPVAMLVPGTDPQFEPDVSIGGPVELIEADFDTALSAMQAHVEEDYLANTVDLRKIEQEHRDAIARIQLLG